MKSLSGAFVVLAVMLAFSSTSIVFQGMSLIMIVLAIWIGFGNGASFLRRFCNRWSALPVALALVFLLFSSPTFAQESTPVIVPTASTSVIVAPATEPSVVTTEPTVVVEQPSDTTNIPSWLIANLSVFLVAVAVGSDLIKSAIHARSIKHALETITSQQEGAINAALKAMPPEAQVMYTRLLDFLDTISENGTALLKVAHDVAPEVPTDSTANNSVLAQSTAPQSTTPTSGSTQPFPLSQSSLIQESGPVS